ncbi:3'-5' exonuclease domain-containing protein 2 [bacterium]|nr:3'-5' exonuclease domain-containing protein 2 [bacterium]
MNTTPKSELSLINFKGKIHLITNDQELSLAATELSSATELGFDTETRASFRKGEVYQVALLQLATNEHAYLIRLHGIKNFEIIKSIFENNKTLKVGVAIRDDIKNLQKLFKFTPQNFVELQDLAKKKGLKNFGLKGMTEEVLSARLSKAAKVTNWEVPKLTDQQILYAATDAWIGLELFRKISQ